MSAKDIKEGQKIKIRTGEIGRIAEVFKGGEAFVAEIFRKSGLSVETIKYEDIASVFIETEKPTSSAV